MDYSIDLYLEFEEHFFHTRKTDTKSPDKETEIRETASKYRRLLEQNRRTVDVYLEFEEHFFHTRKTDTKSPDKETEIRETASKYRRLLEQNRRTVDAILVNNSEPEGINREFYQELNELTKSEKKPPNILIKKFNAEQLLEPY